MKKYIYLIPYLIIACLSMSLSVSAEEVSADDVITTIETANQSVDNAQESIDTANQSINNAQQKINESNTQNPYFLEENDPMVKQTESAIQKAEGDVDKAEQKTNEATNAINQAQASVAKYQSSIASIEKEIKQAQDTMNQSSIKNKELIQSNVDRDNLKGFVDWYKATYPDKFKYETNKSNSYKISQHQDRTKGLLEQYNTFNNSHETMDDVLRDYSLDDLLFGLETTKALNEYRMSLGIAPVNVTVQNIIGTALITKADARIAYTPEVKQYFNKNTYHAVPLFGRMYGELQAPYSSTINTFDSLDTLTPDGIVFNFKGSKPHDSIQKEETSVIGYFLPNDLPHISTLNLEYPPKPSTRIIVGVFLYSAFTQYTENQLETTTHFSQLLQEYMDFVNAVNIWQQYEAKAKQIEADKKRINATYKTLQAKTLNISALKERLNTVKSDMKTITPKRWVVFDHTNYQNQYTTVETDVKKAKSVELKEVQNAIQNQVPTTYAGYTFAGWKQVTTREESGITITCTAQYKRNNATIRIDKPGQSVFYDAGDNILATVKTADGLTYDANNQVLSFSHIVFEVISQNRAEEFTMAFIDGKYQLITGLSRNVATGQMEYLEQNVLSSTNNHVVTNEVTVHTVMGTTYTLVNSTLEDSLYVVQYGIYNPNNNTGRIAYDGKIYNITNGQLGSLFSGVANNQVFINGELKPYTGLVQDGTTWKYFRHGFFNPTFTGVSQSNVSSKWYAVRNGILDWHFTGVLQNPSNKKWYFTYKGVHNPNYTGVATSVANGKWYHVRNGVLDWNFTGFSQSYVNNKWYFSRKGVLDWNFTGVAKSIANGKWYHAKKGQLDWGFTGISRSVANGHWYFVRKGALDWSFTGVAKSIANGKWYAVNRGSLNWNGSGLYKSVADGRQYLVRKGTIDWKFTGPVTDGKNNYFVRNGRREFINYSIRHGNQYWTYKNGVRTGRYTLQWRYLGR